MGGCGSKVIWFSEQTKSGFVASFCYLPLGSMYQLCDPERFGYSWNIVELLGCSPYPVMVRIVDDSKPKTEANNFQKQTTQSNYLSSKIWILPTKKSLATNSIPPIQTAHFMSVDFISTVISGPQNPWACLPPTFSCTPLHSASEGFERSLWSSGRVGCFVQKPG